MKGTRQTIFSVGWCAEWELKGHALENWGEFGDLGHFAAGGCFSTQDVSSKIDGLFEARFMAV